MRLKSLRPWQLPLAVMVTFFGPLLAQADAPTAQPDSRSVNEFTAITINVLENDFDVDGDVIFVESVTQPENGQVTLNPDGSIFYQPNEGFRNDTDTFTYTLADDSEEGLVSTGNVSVTVVGFNLEPFAGERSNDQSLAALLNSLCADLEGRSDAELGAAGAQLAQVCNALATLNNGDEENAAALAEALTQIAPEEVLSQMRVAVDATRTQVQAVAQRVQQQRVAQRDGSRHQIAFNGRQWLGGAGEEGDSSPGLWSRLGIFANVQIDSAERDSSDLEAGYESDGTTATFGADYFLSQNWLVGGSYSYADSELDYRASGGSLETEISTITAFGAYFNNNLSAYLQMGYGWLAFDSERNVAFSGDALDINETLTSETEGNQVVMNTRVEYDWRREALTLTPFFRADYLQSDIEAFGERGFGGLAMNIGEQNTNQLTLAAGLQTAYAFKPSWGVLVPTATLTLFSEAEDERDPVSAGFAADPDADRSFFLRNNGGDSSYGQIAVGTSAVFPGGVSAFVEYTRLFGYEFLSAYQAQMGVRYEL